MERQARCLLTPLPPFACALSEWPASAIVSVKASLAGATIDDLRHLSIRERRRPSAASKPMVRVLHINLRLAGLLQLGADLAREQLGSVARPLGGDRPDALLEPHARSSQRRAVSKRCSAFISKAAGSGQHAGAFRGAYLRKVRHTSTTVAEEPFEMAADAVIEGRLTKWWIP
jgi:hypothetical protein